MIMASNPETTPLFRHIYEMHLENSNNVKIVQSSIYDNPYLNPSKRDAYVKQWKGTRYEKMQLLGQLDWTQDGALWNMDLINTTRIPKADTIYNTLNNIANPDKSRMQYRNPYQFFRYFIICVDPAMSVSETSDETGIIIAALGSDGHVYIIEDLTDKYHPDEMAEVVMQARSRYPNLYVGIETNQGGMYVLNALKIKDPMIRMIEEGGILIDIKATQNKMTRAQHIVILWDKRIAHIVGKMDKLEQQMIFYTGKQGQKSPDRFDAMVMACQQLAIEQQFKQSPVNISSFPRLR
jgi:predicted phage terminase large subunit-like protein